MRILTDVKNWEELSERYRTMADIYLMHYEDAVQPAKDLMSLMGLIVQMQSDLLQFKTKSNNKEKVAEAQSKIDFLHGLCQRFSTMHDRNRQYMFVLREKEIELVHLRREVETLRAEQEAHLRALNED